MLATAGRVVAAMSASRTYPSCVALGRARHGAAHLAAAPARCSRAGHLSHQVVARCSHGSPGSLLPTTARADRLSLAPAWFSSRGAPARGLKAAVSAAGRGGDWEDDWYDEDDEDDDPWADDDEAEDDVATTKTPKDVDALRGV